MMAIHYVPLRPPNSGKSKCLIALLNMGQTPRALITSDVFRAVMLTRLLLDSRL